MYNLPDAESAETVADWVELELAAGEEQLSKAKISSIVESVGGADRGEPFLTDVWRHLEERQTRYSKRFFSCEANLIRSLPQAATPEYKACLLFSLFGVSDEHRTDPKIFERIVASAIKNYLHGKVFVFGWPVLPGVQADITKRVKDVATETREKFAEPPRAEYKDRGVDVIAWQPFEEHLAGEHRSGQVVILAQCAAGRHWRLKTGQLPIKAWTQYLHWSCDPLQGFAVPCVIPQEHWHDLSRESAGILFDRIRIVNLLPNGVGNAELTAQIDAWIQQELEESTT